MCHGQFHFHMSHAQHEELEYYNQFILTLPLNILMALPRKVFVVIGITGLKPDYTLAWVDLEKKSGQN